MKVIIIFFIVFYTITSCKSLNKSQKGVLIGAGAGGATGAAIGKARGNTALGAIIGAAVGGIAGGIIGRQMDKQADELNKIPGAEVKRVGEGINVTFDSGVLFDLDKYDLSGEAENRITDVAAVLNKYPETYILIEGHTDATGTPDYNLTLSRNRSSSVAQLLSSRRINSKRIKTNWYGESQPKFPNDSESNRSKNRRVEFAIYANEELVQKARNASVSKEENN